MKTRIIIAAALLAASCTPGKSDLEKYALNCKAEEIALQSDTLEFPYIVRFNPDGQVREVITRNFDLTTRYTETYTYDDKNQLIEISGVNADNETEQRHEYEHDGRFVKECRVYGMNNQEMHRWVHTNDHRHIIRTEYFSEGEPAYITTKSYRGNTYKEQSVTPEGELIGEAEVEFLTEQKPRSIKSDTMDIEITYNEKGLPTMSRGTLLNSLGEMEWASDLDEHPCRYYSYEYDERGNWISRAESVHPDSTAYSVLRRTIKYQK